MRTIPIVHDQRAFEKEMKNSGEGKVPVLRRQALATVGPHVYILTGNTTRDFGRRQSGTGYVIARGKTRGSISIEKDEAQQGKILIP